jgi:serine protease AprX
MRVAERNTMTIYRRRIVAFVGFIALLSPCLSAQLLTKLLSPVEQAVDQLACSTPLATSPKLDTAVQRWVQSGGSGTLRVIISAEPGLLEAVESLLLSLGGSLLGELPGINAVIGNVTLSSLAALACASSVSSISLDAVVTSTSGIEEGAASALRATLGLPQNAPAGEGVGVAVIDSGIAASADFGNRIVGFFDFTNGAKATTPSDAFGHGTHVAGLIASAGQLSSEASYQGVGPQIRLIGMKVLDATGAGRTSDAIRAVEYAIARRSALGIQIINLSLGHPIYEPAKRDPLVRAVEAASRSGIVVVTAAGNYGTNRDTGQRGYGGITSPGNAPSAVTVGALMSQATAVRGDDEVAPYSSRGPSWYDGFAKPDLVAPGHSLSSNAAIGSTLYERYPSARVSTSYLQLSGTSMAAAVTSGVVALILEAHRNAHPSAPPLTPNAIKAILQYSSLRVLDPSGGAYDELTQGAGALNAVGAIELARAIDTVAPVGSYWWTTTITPTTTLGGEAWTWAQRLIWGTRVVWGTSVDTNEAAWAAGVTWGTKDAFDDSRIVWGPDVVWDDGLWWPSAVVWGSELVGTSTDDHIVWGTAEEPSTTVWGSLAGDGPR